MFSVITPSQYQPVASCQLPIFINYRTFRDQERCREQHARHQPLRLPHFLTHLLSFLAHGGSAEGDERVARLGPPRGAAFLPAPPCHSARPVTARPRRHARPGPAALAGAAPSLPAAGRAVRRRAAPPPSSDRGPARR